MDRQNSGRLNYQDILNFFYKLSQMANGKYIDHLDVAIVDDEVVDMKNFYKATSRMLGEIENKGETLVSLDGLSIELDLRFLTWKNVTELYVETLTNGTPVAMINQLPGSKCILIEMLGVSVSISDIGELTEEAKIEGIWMTAYQNA